MAKTYSAIQTITVSGSSTSSVTFSNIPQNYTDLKIVMSSRGTWAFLFDGTLLTINGGGTAVTVKRLYGSGSSTASDTTLSMDGSGANATASTFGNAEVYIPNYTSSTNKSLEFNSVTENNGTSAYIEILAGAWAVASPITSLTFAASSGTNYVAGSTFTLYGINAGSRGMGGTITYSGGYAYHTFLSSSSFTPTADIPNADILVVAGGGGGGSDSYAGGSRSAGGGGAGGLVGFTNQYLNAGTSYTVTVGGPGAGGSGGQASSAVIGSNGGDSQFGSLTLVKGGGGGSGHSASPSSTQYPGNAGGSGGGGGQTIAGGAGVYGQGNAGGTGQPYVSGYAQGGGGGAGAIGGSGTGYFNGVAAGGVGSSAYSAWGAATGTGQLVGGVYYYAGGGGGSGSGETGGAGGYGGGGAGGSSGTGTVGTTNTGGGGGAAEGAQNGAAGGSGIVIVRYPLIKTS